MGHSGFGLGWRHRSASSGEALKSWLEAKGVVGLGSMVSHPSRKNKDAAWMGHPEFRLGWRHTSASSGLALKLGRFKTGRIGFYGLPPKPQKQRRGVDGAPGIGFRVGKTKAGWVQWSPTQAAKNKDAAWMGHPALRLGWRHPSGDWRYRLERVDRNCSGGCDIHGALRKNEGHAV